MMRMTWGKLNNAVATGMIVLGLYTAYDAYAASKHSPAKQATTRSGARFARGKSRPGIAPSLERRMQETIATPDGPFVLDHTYERGCASGLRKETKLVVYHESQGHYLAKTRTGKIVLGGDIPTLHAKRGANYYVDKQGVVYSLMPADCQSHGSGVSVYRGLEGTVRVKRGKRSSTMTTVDPVTVNVEFEKSGEDMREHLPFTDAQYAAGKSLSNYLKGKYDLSDDAFKAHAEVAANQRTIDGKLVWERDRRVDGLSVDWGRLGIAHDDVDHDYESGRAIYSEKYQRALDASHRRPESHWYDGIVNASGRFKAYVSSKFEANATLPKVPKQGVGGNISQQTAGRGAFPSAYGAAAPSQRRAIVGECVDSASRQYDCSGSKRRNRGLLDIAKRTIGVAYDGLREYVAKR